MGEGGKRGVREEERGTDLREEVSGRSCDGRWEDEVVVKYAFVHHVHIAVVEGGLLNCHPTPNTVIQIPMPVSIATEGVSFGFGFGFGFGLGFG